MCEGVIARVPVCYVWYVDLKTLLRFSEDWWLVDCGAEGQRVPYSDMAAHPNDYYVPSSLPLPLEDPYRMEYDDAVTLISHLRCRDASPAFEFHPYSLITSNISNRISTVPSRPSTAGSMTLTDDNPKTGAKDKQTHDDDGSVAGEGDSNDNYGSGVEDGDGKHDNDGSDNGDGKGNDGSGDGDESSEHGIDGSGNGDEEAMDLGGDSDGDSNSGKEGRAPVFDEDDEIEVDNGDNGSDDGGEGSEIETDGDIESTPVRARKATHSVPPARQSKLPAASEKAPVPPVHQSK
jgi:hypothetical protein